MLIDYHEMPLSSRVWIYQADRAFDNNEEREIRLRIENFINAWKRHGEDLKASYVVKYNQFIVLLVDEKYNDVSGCAIDASVNLIKKIENDFAVDLTNKLNVSFKDADNINIVSLADFQKYVKLEKITSNTTVFNNLVANKSEFESKWEVPASQSWHQRFFTHKV